MQLQGRQILGIFKTDEVKDSLVISIKLIWAKHVCECAVRHTKHLFNICLQIGVSEMDRDFLRGLNHNVIEVTARISPVV